MPDYIYLLENRLSADQRNALKHLREAARQAEMILFLTGDAVRDLTSGHAVRDIEVAVHGNALDLKRTLTNVPVQVWGEDAESRSLYLCFPGTVRVDVVSTHRTEYPKPGQPVNYPASIHEDLRRRDFTVNAMALSLNEGSFGLLMDPLNGAADIETRTLRLVSNYGFLEEPALLIRATRYLARLGWEFDPKTQTRYENAKAEGVIELLSAHERSRELEQIGHEDDGLKVLHAHENEGWMRFLYPPWTPAKADEDKLKALHSLAIDLLVQGVHADVSAAQMQLLTAKMAPKDLAGLKKLMLRQGFVEEWNSLDTLASGFSKVLLAKENQVPSAAYKLFTTYDPEAVLWLGFTSKEGPVKDRYNKFLKEWPEVRQRIPHALMQEMRIKPELANYNEILQAIFLQLIDGKLTTPEEMRAFLEPYSPPAPPPQVTIKRTRAKRGEAKIKDYDDEEEESDDDADGEEDLDDMGGDDDEIGLGMNLPKVDLEPESGDDEVSEEPDEDDKEEVEDAEPAPARRGKGAPKFEADDEEDAPPAGKTGKSQLGRAEPEPKHPAKPVAVAAKPTASGSHAAKTAPAPASAKVADSKVKQPPAKNSDLHAKPSTAKVELKKPAPKPAAKSAPAKHASAKPHSAPHAPAKHVSAPKGHKPTKPAAKKAAGKKH